MYIFRFHVRAGAESCTVACAQQMNGTSTRGLMQVAQSILAEMLVLWLYSAVGSFD
jgi:hypothetical protein